MDKIDNTAQMIGEFVLYIPLLVIAIMIDSLLPCVIAMICLFTYKQFYSFTVHLATAHCLLLSYGIFVTTAFAYIGLQAQFRFMRNQPMTIVLIIAMVALINAEVGQLQHDYAVSLCKLSELDRAFDLGTATVQEIVFRCNQKHLSKDAAETIIMRYADKMTPQEIADRLHIEKASVDTKLYRARKKLNSP